MVRKLTDSEVPVLERYSTPSKGAVFFTYSYVIRYFDTKVPITMSVFENNPHLKRQTFKN